MRYVTADTHFGHQSIWGKDGFVSTRAHFTSVEEMNETIIANWNNVVQPEDEVILAGDIALHMKPKEIFVLLKRLHGTILIIEGNHDSVSKTIKYLLKNNYTYNRKPKFEYHELGIRIKYNKRVYYVTHYPLGLGERRRVLRNLCGHIHESIAHSPNVLNIGVDSPEIDKDIPFGTPIPFERAVELVESKIFMASLLNGLDKYTEIVDKLV